MLRKPVKKSKMYEWMHHSKSDVKVEQLKKGGFILTYMNRTYRVYQKNGCEIIKNKDGKLILRKKKGNKIVQKLGKGHLTYLCYPHSKNCVAKIHLTIIDGEIYVRIRKNQKSGGHFHTCKEREIFSVNDETVSIPITGKKRIRNFNEGQPKNLFLDTIGNNGLSANLIPFKKRFKIFGRVINGATGFHYQRTLQ